MPPQPFEPTKEQRAAFRTKKRRVAVIAGPGTGKTTVILERIRHLMKRKRVKQYALFKNLDDQVQARTIKDAPHELESNKYASAYFGILRLVSGDDQALRAQRESYINTALEIERDVRVAVAENSLNVQNIEAAVRKTLLPKLFNLVGLDQAKQVIDQVVNVTKMGLSKGNI